MWCSWLRRSGRRRWAGSTSEFSTNAGGKLEARVYRTRVTWKPYTPADAYERRRRARAPPVSHPGACTVVSKPFVTSMRNGPGGASVEYLPAGVKQVALERRQALIGVGRRIRFAI